MASGLLIPQRITIAAVVTLLVKGGAAVLALTCAWWVAIVIGIAVAILGGEIIVDLIIMMFVGSNW